MKKKTPAATGAGTSTSETNSTVPGPVQKLSIIAERAKDPDLSRTELAALCVLANGMNSKTGVHWRSFNSWAEATGSSLRQVKRAMARLQAKGYAVLVRPGTRQGKPNVYKLGSVIGDTTLSEVVTQEVIGSDVEGQKVVTPTTPLSMTLSEPIARIERNRSSEGDATPGGPAVAALGQRQPDKSKPGRDLFPEFWAVYPLRAGVANAEGKLSDLIRDGVDIAEIIAGARRYAEYCKATKQVRRSSADSWLDRQSWRDEWSMPNLHKKEKPEKEIFDIGEIPEWAFPNINYQEEMESYTKKLKAWEIEYKSEIEKYEKSEERHLKLFLDVENHALNCEACEFKDVERDNFDKLCPKGNSLYEKYSLYTGAIHEAIEEAYDSNKPEHPKRWYSEYEIKKMAGGGKP